MIALESISGKLGTAGPWVQSRGVWWLNSTALRIREVAQIMIAAEARFVTITAYQLPGNEGFRLEYHWDLEGRLLGIPFLISAASPDGAETGSPGIDSIFDLCEAADWIEREIHEEYSITFTGRECVPLLLRKGDATGVNLREGKTAAGAPGQAEVAK